eukprot:6213920-Pleurochrysis_carterae.AAC.1
MRRWRVPQVRGGVDAHGQARRRVRATARVRRCVQASGSAAAEGPAATVAHEILEPCREAAAHAKHSSNARKSRANHVQGTCIANAEHSRLDAYGARHSCAYAGSPASNARVLCLLTRHRGHIVIVSSRTDEKDAFGLRACTSFV